MSEILLSYSGFAREFLLLKHLKWLKLFCTAIVVQLYTDLLNPIEVRFEPVWFLKKITYIKLEGKGKFTFASLTLQHNFRGGNLLSLDETWQV